MRGGAAQAALLPHHALKGDAAAPAEESTIFALHVSVLRIKNSGAWNPTVAVYEAAGTVGDGGAERHVYLDHTEKLEGVGTTGRGAFQRQMLVEYFPPSVGAALGIPPQNLRFQLFNAGAKDIAVASDLIASGNVPFEQLASMLGSDPNSTAAVDIFLYSPGNKALSDRLKRQKACIRVSLSQLASGGPAEVTSPSEQPSSSTQGPLGAKAHTGNNALRRTLVVGTAPVPLVLTGGADPDTTSKFVPFAMADDAATPGEGNSQQQSRDVSRRGSKTDADNSAAAAAATTSAAAAAATESIAETPAAAAPESVATAAAPEAAEPAAPDAAPAPVTAVAESDSAAPSSTSAPETAAEEPAAAAAAAAPEAEDDGAAGEEEPAEEAAGSAATATATGGAKKNKKKGKAKK